ncbi:MAG: hypothetical protein HGB31_09330 [Erysipelotrichaceae bacterium]|nr:hypothetical protein [Erysipelotrichaceae bacterium]
MKGAFEFGMVFLFGMMFVILGMSFSQVILTQNQARIYGETILTLIEHQNRYDDSVKVLILANPIQCSVCSSTVSQDALTQRYMITVTYPLSIPLLNYQKSGSILLISRPMNR